MDLDAIRSLGDLQKFVHSTLCARENILADQFGLVSTQLFKNGRSCGWQFAVQGPRSIRLQAIWDADQNLLYCYDARGNRFLKVPLPGRLPAAA